MKKLVVPTDFSDNALCAFRFAMEMVPSLEVALEVMHVFALPGTEMVSGTHAQQRFEEWLSSFVKKGRKRVSSEVRNLPVQTRTLQGLTEAQLIKVSHEPEVKMMVMGAEGSGGIGKKWFGSVADIVARQAHCPVLLVPEGISFSGFRHILFASDYRAADPFVLDNLLSFAALFQSSIHFVHVEKTGKCGEYEKVEQRILDYLFQKGAPSFSFEMSCLQAGDVTHGLEEYALTHKIDLLVMVATSRTFWETLFHRSQTKEMILRSKLPLLVFHLKD